MFQPSRATTSSIMGQRKEYSGLAANAVSSTFKPEPLFLHWSAQLSNLNPSFFAVESSCYPDQLHSYHTPWFSHSIIVLSFSSLFFPSKKPPIHHFPLTCCHILLPLFKEKKYSTNSKLLIWSIIINKTIAQAHTINQSHHIFLLFKPGPFPPLWLPMLDLFLLYFDCLLSGAENMSFYLFVKGIACVLVLRSDDCGLIFVWNSSDKYINKLARINNLLTV